jgi:hypothetical protein
MTGASGSTTDLSTYAPAKDAANWISNREIPAQTPARIPEQTPELIRAQTPAQIPELTRVLIPTPDRAENR